MCSHQNLKNYINKLNIEYYSQNKITEFKSYCWQFFWHSHANVWCHLHWWSWMPQLLQINYATTESVSIHLLQYHICHLHQNNLQSINNNIYANQMQRSGFTWSNQSIRPSFWKPSSIHGHEGDCVHVVASIVVVPNVYVCNVVVVIVVVTWK